MRTLNINMAHVGLLLVLVASVAASREIEFKNCKTNTGSLSCKVKNVKISGCREPTSWVDKDGSIIEYNKGNQKTPCRIETQSTLNFSITFEPGYRMDSLRAQFTVPDLEDCWRIQDGDLCPVDIGPEAGCAHTKCPLTPGQQQRYETSLFINKRPDRPVNDRRIYQLRWKLWNNKDKTHNCCFNIPIQY